HMLDLPDTHRSTSIALGPSQTQAATWADAGGNGAFVTRPGASRCRGGSSSETRADSDVCRSGTGRDAELGVDVFEVAADPLPPQRQSPRDLAVGLASGDLTQNLRLTGSQAGRKLGLVP